MKDSEFQCADCKRIFDKAWSDEEAEIELQDNFPGISKEDCDIICDDCYNKLQESNNVN